MKEGELSSVVSTRTHARKLARTAVDGEGKEGGKQINGRWGGGWVERERERARGRERERQRVGPGRVGRVWSGPYRRSLARRESSFLGCGEEEQPVCTEHGEGDGEGDARGKEGGRVKGETERERTIIIRVNQGGGLGRAAKSGKPTPPGFQRVERKCG